MNQFCHVELAARDFEKVKKFYGEIFDWKFEYIPPMDYLMFNVEGGIGGGFDKSMKASTESGPMIHIQVGDIDATLKKVENYGGKVLRPKTLISPDIGSFAVFHDTEGNRMGIFQSAH